MTYYINPNKTLYDNRTADTATKITLEDGVIIGGGPPYPYAQDNYAKYWFPDYAPLWFFYRLNLIEQKNMKYKNNSMDPADLIAFTTCPNNSYCFQENKAFLCDAGKFLRTDLVCYSTCDAGYIPGPLNSFGSAITPTSPAIKESNVCLPVCQKITFNAYPSPSAPTTSPYLVTRGDGFCNSDIFALSTALKESGDYCVANSSVNSTPNNPETIPTVGSYNNWYRTLRKVPEIFSSFFQCRGSVNVDKNTYTEKFQNNPDNKGRADIRSAMYYGWFYTPLTFTIEFPLYTRNNVPAVAPATTTTNSSKVVVGNLKTYYIDVWFFPELRTFIKIDDSKNHYLFSSSAGNVYHNSMDGGVTTNYFFSQGSRNYNQAMTGMFNHFGWNRFTIKVEWIFGSSANVEFSLNNFFPHHRKVDVVGNELKTFNPKFLYVTGTELKYITFCHWDAFCKAGLIRWGSGYYKKLQIWDAENNKVNDYMVANYGIVFTQL